MQTNQIPTFDLDNSETQCCPRFHPEPWENQDLHFDNKLFVKASTTTFFHVPLNMGPMFTRTWKQIKDSHADTGGFLVLSHDDSAFHSEHLFAVAKEVPGADMVRLSGDFVTKVFEGPFSDARKWCAEMERHVQATGKSLDTTYLFYTTCPKCAKHYGKNYVVGVAKVR